MNVWCHKLGASLLLGALVATMHFDGRSNVSAQPIREADPKNALSAWKANVKVSAVSADDHHSIHAYFNTSPESPDGRWILYYASTTADSHDGEIRIRERATGTPARSGPSASAATAVFSPRDPNRA